MRYFRTKLITVTIILCMVSILAWAEETGSKAKQKKIYPHPHPLHAEVIGQRAVEFSTDEINNWPDFLRALQGKLNILPLGDVPRMIIRGVKPDNLTNDEKTFVVNELNGLLLSEKFNAQMKSRVAFSAETKRIESGYSKTRDKEDLRWLNRGIINDIFLQTAKKGKVMELSKMTCVTCHEAYVSAEKEIKEAGIDERSVMECFSKAIKSEKTMEECIEKANILKKSRIEDYGPLKNYIQRSNPEEPIPFFVAVHPEDPYTFKPLLKKFVCLECHGQERKVTKVKGTDGKMKEVPYLKNRSSRLIKSPKIYMSDSGLACFLAGIEHLKSDPLKGAFFETYVAQNLHGTLSARWPEAKLNFWNVQGRHEVDFIIEAGNKCLALEIKSSTRWTERDLAGLKAFLSTTPQCLMAILAYNGANPVKLGDRLWAIPLSLLLS